MRGVHLGALQNQDASSWCRPLTSNAASHHNYARTVRCIKEGQSADNPRRNPNSMDRIARQTTLWVYNHVDKTSVPCNRNKNNNRGPMTFLRTTCRAVRAAFIDQTREERHQLVIAHRVGILRVRSGCFGLAGATCFAVL